MTNHGSESPLVVSAEPARAFLRFDLDALPRRSIVEQADLILYTAASSPGTVTSLRVHRATEPWDEATVTNMTAPALEDITTRDPGGDDPLVIGVTGTVARWLANPESNFGFALSTAAGQIRFVSREGVNGRRPSLRIAFSLDAMAVVPAGPFAMGCSASSCDPAEPDGTCGCDEQPQHEVHLSEFEIDRTEVTQAAYEDCVVAGECSPPACDWNPAERPNFPVACVTWLGARSYCDFAGKRLPTEAEWEKAARGTDRRAFPWGEARPTCQHASSLACGAPAVAVRVGGLPLGTSPYGAIEMAGNVWEWIADVYDADYYGGSPARDPKGPPAGGPTRRSRRGGAFNTGAWVTRASNRDSEEAAFQGPDTGLRCAR